MYCQWRIPCLRALPLRRFASQAEQDVQLARDWLKTLNSKTIPRNICELSFSRSSGPGGQNVNKVNSKATLKVPLDALLPLVPRLIHRPLRTSRYAAERAQCLIIQSDEERKQSSNVESCFDKLYQLLQSSAKEVIPGETSQEQRNRVQKLYVHFFHGSDRAHLTKGKHRQRAQNEGRIKDKKQHSDKKSSRRGSKYDD
ncbi:Peptide chain release factor class I/class II [Penicillium roqueforti FM164]|uniref:Peptide chain release factor class I/class II n=1 Tax=Penicillium roqueforti (strain FM164) TaxID=1365484 RepID=W6QIN1_PENRF|nr:Peptide chain release factor class I/class II [Penicillium roqueforti FM164]